MSTDDIERLIPAADTDALGLGVGREKHRQVYQKSRPKASPSRSGLIGELYFRRAELEAYKQRLIQQALSEIGQPPH